MRVSTEEQKFESQALLLKKEDCDELVCEKLSGAKRLEKLYGLLERLQKGDTLVVTRLDRLGRSLKELMTIVELLSEKGVNLKSIRDNLDTSTPIGRLFFHVNAAYAQFEREILSERTKEGLAAARAAGRFGGRRPGLTEEGERKAAQCVIMYAEHKRNPMFSISHLCEIVGVSKSTLYKYLRLKGAFK